jgi:rhodanese-related sulfurtransferase
MRIVFRTAGQALATIALALVLGLGVNAVRTRDHVNLQRDYKPSPPPPPDPHDGTEFTELTLDEVRALFADPKTALGVYVFVDARSADNYARGHIPGALHCEHYRFDQLRTDLAARLGGAEKVIVYCSGGDCPDSLDVCRDLVSYNIVLYGNVYLFRGGSDAWHAANLPEETGP